MLHNPQNDLRTIYSVDNLIAWLETRDPDETFNYISCNDCLIHRYFTAMGLPVDRVWADGYILISNPTEIFTYPAELNNIAIFAGLTIGGALEYAKTGKKNSDWMKF